MVAILSQPQCDDTWKIILQKKINPCSPTWSHHFSTSISTSASFWIFELDHQENHNKRKEKSDVSALVTHIVCNTIYAINLFTAPSTPTPPSTHFKTKNMHGTRMWVADGTMSTYEKMKPNQNTGFCQDVVPISYKKYTPYDQCNITMKHTPCKNTHAW